MFRYARNRTLVLIFMSVKLNQKSLVAQRFRDIAKGFSVIYNTRVVNEGTIFATIIQERKANVLFIYINEISLSSRDFRECLLTCITTKAPIILIIDGHLSKDIIFSFFPYTTQRRFQKLVTLFNNGIYLHPNIDLLTLMNNKIKRVKEEETRNSTHKTHNNTHETRNNTYENKSVFSDTRMKSESKSVNYSYRLQVFQKTTFKKSAQPLLSYNMLSGKERHNKSSISNKRIQAPRPHSFTTSHTIASASELSSTKLPSIECVSQPCSATEDEGPTEIKLVGRKIKYFPKNNNQSNPKTIKSEQRISNKSCPVIEISDEDPVFYDLRITDNSDKPWGGRKNSLTVSPYYVTHSAQPSNLCEPKRKTSFEYLAKTYAVFKPEKTSSKILYVNFPADISELQRDSDVSFQKSSTSSRRESYLGASLHSSGDEMNLEFVYDRFSFGETPIQSPKRNNSLIYQKPLPVFPSEICFPPLVSFPCESIQVRRPSIFDVIIN